MARSAALITEEDDGSDEPQHTNGANVDLTPPQAEGQGDRQPQARQRPQEPEFEIVETDNNLRPLREPGLTDSDAGDGTLLDTRRREQQAQRQRGNERPAPRRNRQKEGRDRTFAEMETLRRENEELKKRQDAFEQRFGQIDDQTVKTRIADIDNRIQGQVQAFEAAEDQVATAMTRLAQGDETATADLKKAMRARDSAVITGNQLENAKKALIHQAQQAQRGGQQQPDRQGAQQQEQRPDAPQPLSPRVQALADDFLDRNEWYNVDGNDRDSRFMRVIDQEVAEAGFKPDTMEYWDELEARAREALPHRFQDEAPRRQAQPQRQRAAEPHRNGPMVSGAGEGRASPKSNQVFISPERRDALIKAGVMDADGTVTDKGKFNRICRGYQQIDRDNGVGVRQ